MVRKSDLSLTEPLAEICDGIRKFLTMPKCGKVSGDYAALFIRKRWRSVL
jgi:hypothetical protein